MHIEFKCIQTDTHTEHLVARCYPHRVKRPNEVTLFSLPFCTARTLSNFLHLDGSIASPIYIYIFDGRERTHFDAPGFSWNYHSIYILVCVHNYAPRCWLMGNYTTWLCEAMKGAFAWDKPTISESGKVILLGDNQRFYTDCCGRRIIDRNFQEFLWLSEIKWRTRRW